MTNDTDIKALCERLRVIADPATEVKLYQRERAAITEAADAIEALGDRLCVAEACCKILAERFASEASYIDLPDRVSERIEAMVRERDDAVKRCDELFRDLTAAMRQRDEAQARVREVESAMRDWCVCVHCGARFPTVDSEDHGAKCDKHPMRALEAHAAALREALEGVLSFLSTETPTRLDGTPYYTDPSERVCGIGLGRGSDAKLAAARYALAATPAQSLAAFRAKVLREAADRFENEPIGGDVVRGVPDYSVALVMFVSSLRALAAEAEGGKP